MHILVRDKLADRDYIARHTLGFDKVEREILPRFTPARTAEITGLAVADIEKLASMYGKAKAALIRLGEGMTRLAAGGQALRTVVLLPGVTGHYGVKGRRRPSPYGRVVRPQLQRRPQAVGSDDVAHGEPSSAG
jgi:Anaerobic dehydrogenases, typically selenocysteine-containing